MTTPTRAFVGKALAWIAGHLDGFDPFLNGQEYDVKNGQKVGELAILLHAYTVLTGKSRTRETREIVRLLGSVRERRDFSDRLLRSPQEFILFAEVYSNLRSAGYDSPAQRQLIQRAIDAGYLGFTERLPHRVLDVASCLRRGRFRHSLPPLSELFDKSLLKPVPCPILLDEDALYFLTHVIMFAFDFGARRRFRLSKRYLTQLRHALSALLVGMCHEHHWDLLAELLACWDCLGFGHTPVYERSWTELLAVQKEDGAVPGPEWALRLHERVDADSVAANEPGYYFSHHYHTTLVSIIAGCLRLRRQRELRGAAIRRRDARPVATAPERDRCSLLRRDFASRDAGAALGRCGRWLEGLLEADSGSDGRPEVRQPGPLCGILMAGWICASAGAMSEKRFAELARTIGGRLAGDYENSPYDWSTAPATLKILAGSLLRSQALDVPFLHDRDGYVMRASAALTQHAAAHAVDDLKLAEKRILLNGLGLQPRPPAVDLRTLTRFFSEFRYSASHEAVDELLLYVRSHTRHGARPLPDRPEYRRIGETLSHLALARLRSYDLITACNLLRAARYLSFEDAVTLTCLDYLDFSQRPDGSFGWLGGEERKLAGGSGRKLDPRVDLYLPVTVECLWTLAEASGDWRLHASLPRWTSEAKGRQQVDR